MATDTSDAVDNLEKELVTLARRLRGLQRTLSDEAHPDLEPAQYALLNHVEELAPVRMADLVAGLAPLASYGVGLAERVDVNMAFVELPASAIDALGEAGLLCYRMSPTSVRLVTSWQTTDDDVAGALAAVRAAVGA